MRAITDEDKANEFTTEISLSGKGMEVVLRTTPVAVDDIGTLVPRKPNADQILSFSSETANDEEGGGMEMSFKVEHKKFSASFGKDAFRYSLAHGAEQPKIESRKHLTERSMAIFRYSNNLEGGYLLVAGGIDSRYDVELVALDPTAAPVPERFSNLANFPRPLVNAKACFDGRYKLHMNDR